MFVAAEKHAGMFKPEEFLKKNPVSFPFLLDEDRSITKGYGVYKAVGIDSINIARPACFVVGQDSKLRYIYLGASQFDRAPMEDVLKALKGG